MNDTDSRRDFTILADWGARLETPEAITTRWLALINGLQALDPAFADWSSCLDDMETIVSFDARYDAVLERIVSSMETTEAGEIVPAGGSSTYLVTSDNPAKRSFATSMTAGMDAPWDSNVLILETDDDSGPQPELISYRIFRGALLAMAETFEATQAFAYPSDLVPLWPPRRPGKGRPIPLAWMSYVAPRFAALVEPPAAAVIERRPDGGLLLAAIRNTFRVDDPAHLAAARAIEAALAPFNALPWTAETGK